MKSLVRGISAVISLTAGNSSPAAIAAFSKMAADPYFNP